MAGGCTVSLLPYRLLLFFALKTNLELLPFSVLAASPELPAEAADMAPLVTPKDKYLPGAPKTALP